MPEALLCCPFCGGTRLDPTRFGPLGALMGQITCWTCDALGPRVGADGDDWKTDVSTAWNKRMGGTEKGSKGHAQSLRTDAGQVRAAGDVAEGGEA
jgi:hypothetical protein